MSKLWDRLAVIAVLGVCLAACTTNSITGRQQLLMITPAEEQAMGLAALNEVKQTQPVEARGARADLVRKIGRRIAAVSDRPDMDWEFIVIDEPVLNAWALPGGKVALYTKMIDALSEQELAAVVGHEVAHAVLRHGAEQVSRAQMTQIGVGIAAGVVGASTDGETGAVVGMLAGLAATGFVTLPHSRFMELEADDIGTLYMARAGFDPQAAVSLWQTMNRLKSGDGAQPAFLSTHPSDSRRIARIEAKMESYRAVYLDAKDRY